MKNIKLISILLVLLMLVSVVFVACTGDGNGTTEAPGTTETPNTETDSSETSDETTSEPDPTDPPHTHSFGPWNTVKVVSCKEEGLVERICSCGEKETDKIPVIDHRAGEWVIDKEATATEEGSKHQPCAVCGETLKTEVIPATPHVPGEWIVDKEATCTEDGSKHRVCTKCGETSDTEVIPAKGHTEVIDAAKDATCTEKGLTEGKHCSVCNEVFTSQAEIAAKGHTEVIDAAKNATCTEKGLTEGKHCTVCKEVTLAQSEIAAKGHTETDWIVDKEATLTETGKRHKDCTVCGVAVVTETIPVVEPHKTEYCVTVVDGNASPLSGIKVVFRSSSASVGEVNTDADGKAVIKLADGEYEAEVIIGDAYYVSGTVQLTVSAPAAEVVAIGYVSDLVMEYPDETNGYYNVNIGAYRVPVEKDVNRLYVFYSGKRGIYKISVDTPDVEVGYYGGAYFLLPNNIGEYYEDGSLKLTVKDSEKENSFTIGLKSKSASVDECTLKIEWIEDMPPSPEELPYEHYNLEKAPSKADTPAGNRVYVDIAVDPNTFAGIDEIKVVYNAADGFYHLNTADGPVLYVTVAQATNYQESLFTIASTTIVGAYFYDENNNFIRKEDYNDALQAYGNAADATYGVVPLDDDLIYILKNMGREGWYKKGIPERTDWIFGDTIVADANCWLFPVCYFE